MWNERGTIWTRYDGKAYRKAVVSGDLNALRNPSPLENSPDASPERRATALNQAVEDCIMAGGTVMQRTDYSAIIGQKKPIPHGAHIFLCIITLGLWLTPYLIIALVRKDIRYRVEADRWAHVWPTLAE